MKIRNYATARVKYGYRRIDVLLQREGLKVHRKRVYRLYCLENLNMRLTSRRKQVARPHLEIVKESLANKVLGDGLRLKTSCAIAMIRGLEVRVYS